MAKIRLLILQVDRERPKQKRGKERVPEDRRQKMTWGQPLSNLEVHGRKVETDREGVSTLGCPGYHLSVL